MKTPDERTETTDGSAHDTTNGTSPHPATATRPTLPMSEEAFRAMNKRRYELIDKRYEGSGLTEEEEQEFIRLQQETDKYVEGSHPLSFAIFDKMKEICRREGISLDDFPE